MSDQATPRYRGRFAPSPTGPLHFGSLVAAVGSYLQARANGGEWLVRIEDIDPPREAPGAADEILRTLDRLGLHWDGAAMYQSTRRAAYEDALEQLRRSGLLYACGCSRREIADSSVRGIEGPVYAGTCRSGLAVGRDERALRIRTDGVRIVFSDRWQGTIECALEREVGDFVLRRADGFIAYQLAVAVDDAAQAITEVVRGADLLLSTPRQIHILQQLGLVPPRYAHLPVAINACGEKLSKQTGATAIAHEAPRPLLARVLAFLGQPVTPYEDEPLDDFWRRAVRAWRPESVPRVRAAG